MSPRVTAAPSDVQSGIEIYPKGTYEMKIESAKAFEGNTENEKGVKPHGVRYLLTITSPADFRGKRFLQNCYYHNEGSQSMTKQFLMAATGSGKTRSEENSWNEAHSNDGWAFDTDDGSIGDGWQALIGKVVVADLDVGMNKQRPGEEQQKVTWRPVK